MSKITEALYAIGNGIHQAIAFAAWLTIGPAIGICHGIHWVAVHVVRWWFARWYSSRLHAVLRLFDETDLL